MTSCGIRVGTLSPNPTPERYCTQSPEKAMFQVEFIHLAGKSSFILGTPHTYQMNYLLSPCGLIKWHPLSVLCLTPCRSYLLTFLPLEIYQTPLKTNTFLKFLIDHTAKATQWYLCSLECDTTHSQLLLW